jgi:hypothetical protein
MKNKVNIEIEYLIRSSKKWKSLDLVPEEYFDLEYNEDTAFDVDSLPKYDDVNQYLKVENQNLECTFVTLENIASKAKRTIKTTFWNEGENQFTEVKQSKDNQSHHEIIYSAQVKKNPIVYEILRCTNKGDIFYPTYHGFITDNPDGTQSEEKIFPIDVD